jgi:hypothetical protein
MEIHLSVISFCLHASYNIVMLVDNNPFTANPKYTSYKVSTSYMTTENMLIFYQFLMQTQIHSY